MNGLDYDQLFPGRFLKAGDFGGRDVTVTISAVDLEELPQEKGGDRTRGIVSFQGKKKKLVLNRTNGESLKALFGRRVDDWIGKRITLYPATWNGDLCIRVKGSPDIESDVTFELKLPRKRPQKVTLKKTATGKANGKAAPEPEPTPEPEREEIVDTETGEVF